MAADTTTVEAEPIDITRHQGLVGAIARRYLGYGLDFEDLCQEGNIGLIYAAERFEPWRGIRFSTYACHWIRNRIRRAVGEKGSLIRTPLYTQWHGRESACSELARRVRGAGYTSHRGVLAELVAPGEEPGSEVTWELVAPLLDRLPPARRLEIRLRYGLDGKGPRTLREIGAVRGVTRERIRQGLEEGLKLLRREVTRALHPNLKGDPGA